VKGLATSGVMLANSNFQDVFNSGFNCYSKTKRVLDLQKKQLPLSILLIIRLNERFYFDFIIIIIPIIYTCKME